MARLTWDTVAGPNFNGISDSYRNMSNLLGNAVQSGLSMIDTVRNTNAGAADRAIMARLAGVQDPSQFNAASIIGADGANASTNVLQAVGNRPGTLLDWATSRNTLEQSQYGFGRIKDANAILDNPENRDAIAEARMRASSGDLSGAQQIASRLGLRTDQFASLFGDLEQSATGALNRNVTQQRLDEAIYGHGRRKRDDEVTDQTAAAMADISRNAADSVQAARQMYAGNYSPEVLNNLIARGIGSGPSGGASTGSAGGGGIAAALGGAVSTSPIGSSGATFAEPQRAVASVLQGAGIAAPVIAGIMGNLYVEGGYGGGQGDRGSNPGRGDGGAASGIAQWREGRRDAFRQRYGMDPHQATHQQQAEYMLWELTTPEGRRSAGVSAERANEILSASTPQQAAELFDKYYERSNGAHRDRRVAAANDFANMFDRANASMGPVQSANTQFDISRANTMANSGSLNQRLANMEGQDVDMPTLTKSLTGEGGPLTGYSEGEIAREIRAIAKEGGISNAQAAEILKENYVPRNRLMGAAQGLANFGNTVPILNWIVPDGQIATNTFDREMNLKTARDYKSVGAVTVDQNNTRAAVAQSITQAQQKVQSLTDQITAANERYRATQSPQMLERIRELQMERAMLLPQLDAMIQMQQNTRGLTARDFEAEAKRQRELVNRGVQAGVNFSQPSVSTPTPVAVRRNML